MAKTAELMTLEEVRAVREGRRTECYRVIVEAAKLAADGKPYNGNEVWDAIDWLQEPDLFDREVERAEARKAAPDLRAEVVKLHREWAAHKTIWREFIVKGKAIAAIVGEVEAVLKNQSRELVERRAQSQRRLEAALNLGPNSLEAIELEETQRENSKRVATLDKLKQKRHNLLSDAQCCEWTAESIATMDRDLPAGADLVIPLTMLNSLPAADRLPMHSRTIGRADGGKAVTEYVDRLNKAAKGYREQAGALDPDIADADKAASETGAKLQKLRASIGLEPLVLDDVVFPDTPRPMSDTTRRAIAEQIAAREVNGGADRPLAETIDDLFSAIGGEPDDAESDS